MAKYLKTILRDIPVNPISDIPRVLLHGISADSRQVQPGFAFVAIKGDNVDGNRFIPDAIENGACLIVSEHPKPHDLNIAWLQLEGDLRAALAHMAAALHGFPARKLRVIGVTGTDGKTTTSSMIHHLLTKAGIKAGMITTVNALIGDQTLDTGFHVTTPDSPDIQGYMRMMVEAGITHCVLECTSHGLAQGRVIAADIDIAVITNITHEHLDYHGSLEAYVKAKGMLVEALALTPRKRIGNPRLAVLNKDDEHYGYTKRLAPGKLITYSRLNQADIWADEIDNKPEQLRFTGHIGKHSFKVQSPMIGLFNVSNVLAALGATVLGLGLEAKQAARDISSLPPVPGRMEVIQMGQNFTAIVDFAHTPNALERSLETIRLMSPGKLITVYGSAGLRDREKRRMMPKVSIKGADISILTAEDPRTESLDAILEDMAQAAIEAGGVEGRDFFRVPDRGDAIRKAIELAQPGDTIVAQGKGHEQSMCFIDTEYLWDDRTAMRAALAEHLGIEGPKMPYLPTSKQS